MRPLKEIRNYMDNYHVKSGVYHYYRNEFKQALGFLRKALAEEASLNPGDRENARCYLALSLKGSASRLAASDDLDAALEDLRSAVEVRPDFPDLHYQMAQLLERSGLKEEAIEAYRRAVDGHGGYLGASVALGYCLTSVGRREEAADAFARALVLKVERFSEPCSRGLELLQSGDVPRALELMQEVFLSVPELAEVRLEQALELLRSEEYERSLIEFDRALELNPHFPDLYNFRGIVLCELARPEDAVASFRRAAELCPAQVVPRLNLAFALLRAGEVEQAEAELQSILENHPSEPVAAARLEELRQTDRRAMGARPGSG
jgi:tetratricopeptide (TPR) repeat protein